ncbi:MAG TPA: homocysteine S-methyltransferase family protein, partial [Thermomicrobiales bacterium]|nr:homocysteine S-methyltransferase family protein [Thermomicrobiales bacterium]
MTPQTPFTNRRYLDAIAERVLIYDGAMGTSIQALNLAAEDFGGERTEGCNDYLVITRPDVIRAIHASFLEVGSEVIETDTFRSNRLTLAEYGLQDRVHEINFAAAQLAREVADEYEARTGIQRFVAGSMGPSGKLPSSDDPDLSNITFDDLADVFAEQARALVEGGADVLLLETSQDILEVRAAVAGIQRYFEETGVRIPLQAQITLDTSGRMLFGTEIGAALTTLEALPIDVLGLNCSTGPEHMAGPVKYLTEHSTRPISVLPNAGLPINVDGDAVYPMQPEPFAELLGEFVDWGVNVVGGCCGTTPEHLARLIERVKGTPECSRAPLDRTPEIEPAASSGMRAMALQQSPPPTLIGERVNSQGSRKIKRLLLEDDYDSILDIARQQVEAGAHILDVCVALTERADEADQMRKVVKKLSMGVDVPLMIDSTEADVIEAALKIYPGRALINSINLENGRERIDAVVPLAVEHGAAVVALTIDQQGMAKTAERKVEVARAIYEIVVDEYGLAPSDLIFDALTFPLTTGDEDLRGDAMATIEAIRRIKAELPGVYTTLGVSNVSFGIAPAARHVLNSVFLFEAIDAGLDSAIVHAGRIMPLNKIPEEQLKVCRDLIYDRRDEATGYDPLAALLDVFADVKVAEQVKEDRSDWPVERRLEQRIIDGDRDGLTDDLDEALAGGRSALSIINDVLLNGMKVVGDLFGSGQMQLPFVLQSAETMKAAVAHLEPHMEKVEGGSGKGRIVLATVKGDVHDIGKNLVDIIL